MICVPCGKDFLLNKYDDKKGNLLISDFGCFMGDECKSKVVVNE